MTRKIIFFGAALTIGAGVIAASILFQPERETTAYAASEMAQGQEGETSTTEPAVVADEAAADFLNYDMVIGDKNAPVEIIEYAAISCPHCAAFHRDVLPELKEKYLDTGKAKLIYRNFIFDNPFDVFASTLTRCVTAEKFFPTVKTYFDFQKVWMNYEGMKGVFEKEGRDAAILFAQAEVANVGKMAGISEDQAKACFKDGSVIKYLLDIRKAAVEKYNVDSTPTLIVGGKKIDMHDMASIEKAIEEAGK